MYLFQFLIKCIIKIFAPPPQIKLLEYIELTTTLTRASSFDDLKVLTPQYGYDYTSIYTFVLYSFHMVISGMKTPKVSNNCITIGPLS